MNNNYRLQLRHGAEARNFSTRGDVFAYIDGQLQYGGVSLLPYEPILFYYGEDEKNAIIMVGLPEGQVNNGKSYFIIDTADLKEQIDAIDEKYAAVIEELKAKDVELQEAIEKETEERKAADEAEAEARAEKDAELEKAIEDEAEARAKKDAELQDALEFTKDDLKSVIEACGLIYNEKLAEDRVSYVPDSHDEVIRDARDITEAIDKISKFAVQLAKEMKISVANTDTVNLTLTPNEKDGGNTITADVNIAGTEGLSKKNYDNNIIGKTVEGLYASASLEPSTTNPNKLIFKTSGYINGVFKVDAFETEVDLTAYKGDNGKNTGITVNVDTNDNKISAELNLSSDKNNILKLEDGEYVVKGTSKNITYKDGTVFSALNEQSNRIEEIEDTIEFVKAVEVKPSESDTVSVTVDKSTKGDFVVGANVKLSKDKSIIVSNGGLKADVSASFKKGTSTLFINVGNNEYAIDLSDLAVSVLKSAQYDASTEELVLEFIVGDTTKTVRVPVGTLIHDVEVDDTDTVDMTLQSTSGGPNHISAEVKIDKTHSDNILTITSNGLYVAKAYITEAVKEEANERKDADNEIKAALDRVSELANSNKEAIATEATTARAAEKANADAIAQEIKDARAAEKTNADAIAENKAAIKANEVAIGAEVGRAKAAEQANATAITAEETRAMAAEAKNASDINAEITRATEKEADLLEKIGNNTEKIGENKTAIASEVERATKAEKEINDKASANDSAIKAEAERAKLAEQANTTAIQNEVNRATTAETELRADVDKNKADVAEAKSTAEQVKSDLGVEVTRAKAAEATNAQAVVSEKERAMAAEQVNATAITTEETRAMTAEAELKADIEKNKTDIATAKSVADKAASDLAVEISRAKVAEEANATAIAKEINDARTAENKLKEDLEGAIAIEKERAEHVESDLLEKINKNASDIQSISTEVGNIELRKEGDLSYALYVNGTKHGELTIPKDQFLKSVYYDYTTKELVFTFNTSTGETIAKVSIADLIDTYNAGYGLILTENAFSIDRNIVPTKDVLNAELAIVKNGISDVNSKIVAEIARASEKESDLEALINGAKGDINAIETKVSANELNINTLQNKLDTEVARATTEEGKLKELIESESSRAIAAEGVLTENVLKNKNEIGKNAQEISDEKLRATTAELALELKVTNEATRAQDAESAISTLLENEVNRAKAAEKVLEDKISVQEAYTSKVESDLNKHIEKSAEDLNAVKGELNESINSKANAVDVYTKEEILDKLYEYAKVSDVQSKLDEKLNITDASNIYATKDNLQEVKDNYATNESVSQLTEQFTERVDSNDEAINNFNLTYNSATGELVYTDKNGVNHTYQLYSGSLIKKGEFDSTSNSIVLTIENAGVESQITIPVSELLSDLSDKIKENEDAIKKLNEAISKLAKDWEAKSSSTVDLIKSTAGEKDTLTATVRVASSNKQAIQSTGDGLYVSNDLEDYTCVFGAEGTISGQNAVSKLVEKTTLMESEFDRRITENTNEIARVKEQVLKNTNDISTLKTDAQTNKFDISELKNKVSEHTENIKGINEKIEKLGDRVTATETRLTTAEKDIEKLGDRITKVEGDIVEIKDTLQKHEEHFTTLDNKIAALTQLVDEITGGSGTSITTLLTELEKIKKVTAYDTYSNPKNMSIRLDELEDKIGDDIVGEIDNIKNVIIGPKDGSVDGSVWHELNNLVDAGTF